MYLPKGRLSAWVLIPEQMRSDLPPLVALHGISRDARAIREAFAVHALTSGRVLVAPRFSQTDWPGFQRIGARRPDHALLALFMELQSIGINTTRVELFGFSGGAQLPHRFAMLYPQRIARLHVAAAGWYCLPDTSIAFPAGLGDGGGKPGPDRTDIAAICRVQLPEYLRLPLRLYVGAEDTERDPALRADPLLDAIQGCDRVARARTYAAAFASAARAHGIIPDVTFSVLPDSGHNFALCARRGGLAARVLA
ncbi:alpha/beta fold hydrolase [Brenneria rubrifaciens]|uniref:Alpha/beta hydrolase n=1 Tax=Brenneria rubrifaciens TaxID=55213 RepID=A0A4V1FA37_9GAMM|nr:alpha/beta hydrolase [Brenneria rubrifaciens]QCR09713.1 alpha/beta hydrolase [Brenneria rubrifaciens]